MYHVMFLFMYTLKMFTLTQLRLSPQAFVTFIWWKLSKSTVVFSKVQHLIDNNLLPTVIQMNFLLVSHDNMEAPDLAFLQP